MKRRTLASLILPSTDLTDVSDAGVTALLKK